MPDQQRSWRLRAACRDHPDPDVFFPLPVERYKREAAQLICATCPVTGECRAEGTRLNAEGIWGGQQLQRAAERGDAPGPSNDPRCGTDAGYQAHRRRRESPCQPCRDAVREAARVRSPIEHGTERGYRQHRRRSEPACDECRDAANYASRYRRYGLDTR